MHFPKCLTLKSTKNLMQKPYTLNKTVRIRPAPFLRFLMVCAQKNNGNFIKFFIFS